MERISHTRADLPTIQVANGRIGFYFGIAYLMVFGGVLAMAWREHGPSVWIGLAGALVLGLLLRTLWKFGDRRPKLIIAPQGIEVLEANSGLIRWHNILHIELISGTVLRRERDFLVVYYVLEPGQPPPGVKSKDPPLAFAGGDPSQTNAQVWMYLAMLEYSPREIHAEIEARRSGGSGPLTKRWQERL